jgi:hypothetical protein
MSAFVPVAQVNTASAPEPVRLHARLPDGIAIDLSSANPRELSSLLELLCKQYLVELFRALPLVTIADDYEALLSWKMRLPATR